MMKSLTELNQRLSWEVRLAFAVKNVLTSCLY
jgi:hypothetical protein